MKTKLFLLLAIQFSLPLVANAGDPRFDSSVCGGNVSCSSQNIDERSDNRQPLGPVVQPQVTSEVMGSCGKALPLDQSYKASLNGISCGSGGDNRPRKTARIPDDVMEKWQGTKMAGKGLDGQIDMQAARKMDEKLSGTIDYPVTESWNYKVVEGGFDATHCGTSPLEMNCYVNRTETYYTYEDRNDGACDTWAADPPPEQQNSGSGYTGYSGQSNTTAPRSNSDGSSGYAAPRDNPPPQRQAPATIRGESKQDFRNNFNSVPSGNRPTGAPARRKNSMLDLNEILTDFNSVTDRPLTTRSIGASREIAGACIHYALVRHQISHTRSLGAVSYRCTVPRPNYCTWESTRLSSRACPKQTLKYTVDYLHDPNWKPGYKSSDKNEARDYSDMIPNKFDLLLGESEERQIVLNKNSQSSSKLNVQLNVVSKYNDYKINPVELECKFNVAADVKLEVNTIGRKKTKAPSLLELPEDGKPLKFDKGRPSYIHLHDGARSEMLDASTISRAFPGTSNVDPQYFKTHPKESEPANGTGWWVNTKFKIQLFFNDGNGEPVSVISPNTPNVNQVRYFMDSLDIGLEGQGAMDRVYRPTGPLEYVFGGVYRHFGLALTPGQKYYLRVQMVNGGLPFYESGCRGGKRVCEGETASKDSYSEPLDIEFTADPKIDNRTWFKKFADWQIRHARF